MRQADRISLDRLAAALAPAAGRRLWIAYSGGLDSHVLLHAAAGLRDSLRCDLCAVHIHHGLQSDADTWAEHCASVCAALALPLTLKRLALTPASGESLEAVARDARYAAFRALLGPGEVLATAQHRDDQAETLLLALLRGAGVHGLAAMPSQATLGAGLLLRPLLDLPRAAIADYAREHRLRWVEDPSNADPAHDRNRLRALVIPKLRRRWPALDRTLARSASHCAEAAELLDGFADELLAGLAADAPGALSISRLRALDKARQRLLLRRWLMHLGFGAPSAERLRCIVEELLPAPLERQPLVAWCGCEVRRYRDALYALPPLPEPPPTGFIRAGDGLLQLPPPLGELRWSLAPGHPGVDISVSFAGQTPRCARRDRPSSDLKTLFQAAGIPAWLRPYVPRVFVDDRLAGVAGVGLCADHLSLLRWSGHPWTGLGCFQASLISSGSS